MSPRVARRLRAGLLAGLMGLAAAVVLVEVVLRLVPVPAVEIHRRRPGADTTFFEYDPDLGWRGRPGAAGRFAGWEFESDVRLDARGFRDGSHPAPAAGGAPRILVLGDSITWGHGVEQRERYPDVLGDRLRAAGLDADVVNLAVSGYATDQELLLFRREAGRVCPDLVLLGLYENDLRENVVPAQGRYPKPFFRLAPDGALARENVPVPRIADWSAIPSPSAEPALKSLARRHLRLYAALAFVREAIAARLRPPPAPPQASARAVELTARLVGRLAEEVSAENARFVVLVLPDLGLSPLTGDAARRSGAAHVLDLTPVFARAVRDGARLFHPLDGGHWTPAAHRLAGDTLARFLLDGALVRARSRGCPP